MPLLINKWGRVLWGSAWDDIQPRLRRAYGRFSSLSSQLKVLGLNLEDFLNFYTARVAGFVPYAGFRESGRKVDYGLILASEKFFSVFESNSKSSLGRISRSFSVRTFLSSRS